MVVRSFMKCRSSKNREYIDRIEASPPNQRFAKEFISVISKRQDFKKSAVKAYIMGKAIKRNSVIIEMTVSTPFIVINYHRYDLSIKALALFKKLFDNDVDIMILTIVCGMEEVPDYDLKEFFVTILEGDMGVTETYPLGLYLGGKEMVRVNGLPDNSKRFLSEFTNLLQALGLFRENII